MNKGFDSQRRPVNVVGAAVAIAKIATGELLETTIKNPNKRKSGLAVGKARAQSLIPSRRTEISRHAANNRWGKANSA